MVCYLFAKHMVKARRLRPSTEAPGLETYDQSGI